MALAIPNGHDPAASSGSFGAWDVDPGLGATVSTPSASEPPLTRRSQPSSDFTNVYDDVDRAESYSRLEFPGTYYLAFRDLPSIIARSVRGTRALDFGCGAGRSTRFLRRLGFDVVGVDIAEAMLERARRLDPTGDYRRVGEGSLDAVAGSRFDLVLSTFTFDNVPAARKAELFARLRDTLDAQGRIVNVVSAPEIYVHEWVSFSTRPFPENRRAKTGDVVRIVMLDVPDRRPVVDVLCTEGQYREIFDRARLELEEVHRPLGRADEPFPWKSELTVSPWAIQVLRRAKSTLPNPSDDIP